MRCKHKLLSGALEKILQDRDWANIPLEPFTLHPFAWNMYVNLKVWQPSCGLP